ncbi:MAG: type VI secretion system tip protein VgrG, partial [Gammaproteobacteria bacterium]|nr:type VI secretion system tip protein VgrG [Gammaproteobacteria bacterium]
MPGWSQENRSIGIETTLDDNAPVEGDECFDANVAYNFVLLDIEGGGAISELFSYTLTIASEKNDITAVDLIGQNVNVWIKDTEGNKHYINGYINRFSEGSKVQLVSPGTQQIRTVNVAGVDVPVLETSEPTMANSSYNKFSVNIVPGLWFLTKSSNCRIFQSQTAVEIIQNIINLHNANSDTNRQITILSQLNSLGLPRLDYCVQYRESDFDFISRIAASNGLFYFFNHNDAGEGSYIHSITITNDTSFYGAIAETNDIDSWDVEHSFTNPEWALRDFDFEKIKADQVINRGPDTQKDFDQFDYPGGLVFPNRREPAEQAVSAVSDITHFRDARLDQYIENENTCKTIVTGSGTNRDFFSGFKFPRSSVNYVITSSYIKASEHSYYNSMIAASTFKNTFTAIPATQKYYPNKIKSKPIMHGPQTAIVVGPAGEKVYTDRYGRVRVQFHWDRYGQNNTTSSCWLRVSQGWAGEGWGEMALPHIGHEVIVSFLEGDPDKPIVTGRVYNQANMPPAVPNENTEKYILRDCANNEIKMDSSDDDLGIYVSTKGTIDLSSGDIWSVAVGNSGSISAGSSLSIFGGAQVGISGGLSGSISAGLNYSAGIGGNYT